MRMLNRLEYFNGIKKETLHQIFYKLSPKVYDSNSFIFSPGEELTKLLLLVNGVVEFVTEFDGNEFVIDRVFSGSIINYRNFFMDDEA
jgi:signal-transduction protein with cAMP-binding, CBS, and nucleotidyltransferase domain